MGYDAIVIGAGHNGLTTAALLAEAERKVLVVEQRAIVGGTAAAEEFHPGYRGAGLFHASVRVRPDVVVELELEQHGLVTRRRPPDLLALDGSGPGLLLCGEPERAAEEIRRLSAADADRYLEYRAFLDRVRGVLASFVDVPPIDVVNLAANSTLEMIRRGLRLRRLGRKEMLELLRLPPMAVADWLGEWFESDLLKAALALPAVAGSFMGPRSPGSNANLLFDEALTGPGIAGGGPMLAAALERCARGRGVAIRTGARVERILHDGAQVTGVALDGGERCDAPVVAASCTPTTTLLHLLPPASISRRLEHRMRGLRTRGTTAQVLLAVDRPVRFSNRPGEPGEFACLAGGLDTIEQAFDAVKYRRFSSTPVLDIRVPSVASPELAPHGHAVVSILVHFAPYELDPPWDTGQRERLAERVVELLAPHVPDVPGSIVARQVLAPPDLEARYGLSGGQIHHGEHALDQLLVRPAPECARYATPLGGLFLCGSGSHPGGGLTCAPGAFAARAILSA